ncbi:MAG TPA: hypothetical protein VN457_01305, partial [Chlamydiales bacterium]|nr:hypothetical protein [Chlamydiales bacterium]
LVETLVYLKQNEEWNQFQYFERLRILHSTYVNRPAGQLEKYEILHYRGQELLDDLLQLQTKTIEYITTGTEHDYFYEALAYYKSNRRNFEILIEIIKCDSFLKDVPQLLSSYEAIAKIVKDIKQAHTHPAQLPACMQALETFSFDKQSLIVEAVRLVDSNAGYDFLRAYLEKKHAETELARNVETMANFIEGIDKHVAETCATLLFGFGSCPAVWPSLDLPKQQAVLKQCIQLHGKENANIRALATLADDWMHVGKMMSLNIDKNDYYQVLKFYRENKDSTFEVLWKAIKMKWPQHQSIKNFHDFYATLTEIDLSLRTGQLLCAQQKLSHMHREQAKIAIDALKERNPHIADDITTFSQGLLERLKIRDALEDALKKSDGSKKYIDVFVENASKLARPNWTTLLEDVQVFHKDTLAMAHITARIKEANTWLEEADRLGQAIDEYDQTKIKAIVRKPDFSYSTATFVIQSTDRLSCAQTLLLCALLWRHLQTQMQTQSERPQIISDDKLQLEAFLTRDFELAQTHDRLVQILRASPLTQLSEQQYLTAMQTAKTLLPANEKEHIDAIDFLFRFHLNPFHFTKGAENIVVPPKPDGVTIQQLVELFNTINFTNPNAPHYYDPEVQFKDDYNLPLLRVEIKEAISQEISEAILNEAQVQLHNNRPELSEEQLEDAAEQEWPAARLQAEVARRKPADQMELEITRRLPQARKNKLRKWLKTFINRVVNRTVYEGTPKAGSPALGPFYSTIENALCHVIHTLQALPHVEETDKKNQHLLIADTMIHILRASTHCGPRIYDTAIKRYKARVLNKVEHEADQVYDLAAEYRGILAESKMPPPTNETILYYERFIHVFGAEFGIPAAHIPNQPDALAADYVNGGDCEVERDRRRFLACYNPYSVASWLTSQMSRDDLITLCGAYVPASFMPQLIVDAKATMARMKAEKKSEAEIIKALKDKHEIYAAPQQKTAEVVIADWRRGMYIEVEVVEDMNVMPMKIRPKAITEALITARVLTKAVEFVA